VGLWSDPAGAGLTDHSSAARPLAARHAASSIATVVAPAFGVRPATTISIGPVGGHIDGERVGRSLRRRTHRMFHATRRVLMTKIEMSATHKSTARPRHRPHDAAAPIPTTAKEATARTGDGAHGDDHNAKPPSKATTR
jgi:hypothetical protein